MNNKLFLINGTAGVGKSTIAKKIHQAIPFSLYISVDEIKFSISHFEQDNDKAIALSLKMALLMAQFYLEQGNSVIIDRMIWGGYTSISKMKNIADQLSIEFIHILLFADTETILERADKRGYSNFGKGTHTPEKILRFTNEFKEKEPEYVSTKIDTTNLSEEKVWDEIIKNYPELAAK
jgi:predicted kinase